VVSEFAAPVANAEGVAEEEPVPVTEPELVAEAVEAVGVAVVAVRATEATDAADDEAAARRLGMLVHIQVD
jgi:hypothetical protein